MTKKSRKKRVSKLSQAQRYSPDTGGISAPVQKTKTARVRRTTRGVHIPTDAELTEEYRYVLTDLRRIGLLAVAMLALLIVLAIILV